MAFTTVTWPLAAQRYSLHNNPQRKHANLKQHFDFEKKRCFAEIAASRAPHLFAFLLNTTRRRVGHDCNKFNNKGSTKITENDDITEVMKRKIIKNSK